MYGKQVRGIERSTFVIDRDGKLAREWRKVKVPGSRAAKCSNSSRNCNVRAHRIDGRCNSSPGSLCRLHHKMFGARHRSSQRLVSRPRIRPTVDSKRPRSARSTEIFQEAHGRTQAAPRSLHAASAPLPQAGPNRTVPRDEAVRARHERADARSDEPVPLRRARHLPADPDARGARRAQEGHDRGRAQRAPGIALPRRARHALRRSGHRRHRQRHSARRRSPAARPPARLFLQTEIDLDGVAAVARERQGGQPDPRRRHAPDAALAEAQRDPGVEGHQHAHQGARARHRGGGLLQRQGARGHRAPLLRHARAAGRLLGPPRQGHGVVAAGRAHVLPADRAAGAVAASSTSSCTRRSRAKRRCTRSSRRSRARARSCRRSRTTRTRRTTCGASSRATASRTSR